VDTWQAIDTTRAIRKFAERPLEPEHLRRILDAGRRSGSSKNQQSWTSSCAPIGSISCG